MDKEQIIFILNGGMEVKMDGKNYILKPGDELVFPEKMIHSAKVGHHECEYIDAEKE